MSYRTIGYDQGRPIKVDEGPANCSGMRLRGELVTGQPVTPLTTDADRRSSRRYRAAHPDRVAAYQREYRARQRCNARPSGAQ